MKKFIKDKKRTVAFGYQDIRDLFEDFKHLRKVLKNLSRMSYVNCCLEIMVMISLIC